ncbi:MAG: hypothetical protein IIC58_01245 [Proteobacteria bacterium]|nr:hypothetical protein [Pseudomonadota bacterium]
MNHWLQHDEFVDMVVSHHHDKFTGLITGVSDSEHSFQIGFKHGQILHLSYRITKGVAALDKIASIELAKITEHPTTDLPDSQEELPATSDILIRLSSTPTVTETDLDTINMPPPLRTVQSSAGKVTGAKLRKIIEAAAVQHFGPIGAMVCEERLTHNDQDDANFNTLMLRIAADVGASDSETKAFIDTVTQPLAK